MIIVSDWIKLVLTGLYLGYGRDSGPILVRSLVQRQRRALPSLVHSPNKSKFLLKFFVEIVLNKNIKKCISFFRVAKLKFRHNFNTFRRRAEGAKEIIFTRRNSAYLKEGYKMA